MMTRQVKMSEQTKNDHFRSFLGNSSVQNVQKISEAQIAPPLQSCFSALT